MVCLVSHKPQVDTSVALNPCCTTATTHINNHTTISVRGISAAALFLVPPRPSVSPEIISYRLVKSFGVGFCFLSGTTLAVSSSSHRPKTLSIHITRQHFCFSYPYQANATLLLVTISQSHIRTKKQHTSICAHLLSHHSKPLCGVHTLQPAAQSSITAVASYFT